MTKLKYNELSDETRSDFEKLFGERGACGGCWCMSWRLKKKDFEMGKSGENKERMRARVTEGKTIGILGYIDGEPVGWCSIAPREDFIRLEKSRVLKPVDDKPVWSVSCLFFKKDFRKKGLSSELLKLALQFAGKKGAKIVEGYPTVPYDNDIPAAFAWTGIPSSFERAGFKEVARRSKARPIMRYYL
ncbi:MAG: GNAT family N-acetyltransferase [Bacteroidetes bacterium]|nr:GNAT family N-acetyltransferase [Bacteroidota bacterium]